MIEMIRSDDMRGPLYQDLAALKMNHPIAFKNTKKVFPSLIEHIMIRLGLSESRLSIFEKRW